MDKIELVVKVLLILCFIYLVFIEYPKSKNCVSYCQKEIDYCKGFMINNTYINQNITDNISEHLFNISYYNNSSSNFSESS